MLPRILWRIWIDDPMPETFRKYGEDWRRLHPNWEFAEIRSYRDVPRLRNQGLFDNAKEIIPRDWKRFQADLLRLELIYQFGGVYVDTDVQPLKPLEDLIDRQVMVGWSPNRGPNKERLLTQAIIGSVEGHQFIKDCIEGIPNAVAKFSNQHLAKMVGPWHITRVYRAGEYSFTPLPADTFYPQSVKQRDRGIRADIHGSYTYHRWNSSLRRKGKGLG